jgi:chromosomal replication initiator protein
MKDIWDAAKSILRTRLSESGYLLWVEPLVAETGLAGELVLKTPNAFALRWVQSHYVPLIKQVLEEMGRPLQVKLTIGQSPPRRLTAPTAPQPSLPLAVKGRLGGKGLNKAFTFENFVVGSSNRLAFHASQAMARNDTIFNGVLFLTSPPGLGKSHLSQAVGNFLQNTDSRYPKVLYTTAEEFANDMVRSLRAGQMGAFKDRYRSQCEILLMEEVQFLSGKEKIQAEVCYTLDTLLTHGRRCVFTSRYLPGEITNLSRELRSRFTGGVITPIGPPDFFTRVQILAQKASSRGVGGVSPQVLEYLAEYVTDDVRRLESSLDCLAARATLLGEPVSLRLAQEVLQDLQAVQPRLGVSQIQKIIADYYRVSLGDLLGRSRQKKLVRARQVALYFSRLYTQKTMQALGRDFQRSHASVVHALQTLERDRQTQPRLSRELSFLEEKMAQFQVRQDGQTSSNPRSDA